MSWSKKKGTRAEPIQPAISARGFINAKMGIAYYVVLKKRKTASGSKTTPRSSGTVTGHHFRFIASTLDVLHLYNEFKGYYFIVDNAPIHMADIIEGLIVGCRYGCIYAPPYSLKINPIEQPWSIAKTKLKREKLLKTKTLNTGIPEACK